MSDRILERLCETYIEIVYKIDSGGLLFSKYGRLRVKLHKAIAFYLGKDHDEISELLHSLGRFGYPVQSLPKEEVPIMIEDVGKRLMKGLRK